MTGQFIAVTWPELAAAVVILSAAIGVGWRFVSISIQNAILRSEARQADRLQEEYVRKEQCPLCPEHRRARLAEA